MSRGNCTPDALSLFKYPEGHRPQTKVRAMIRLPLWLAAGAACVSALPFAVRPRPPLPAEPPVEYAPETNAVTARTRVKLHLTDQVMRGWYTVPEAAAVFAWLNRQPPAAGIDDVRRRLFGVPDDADEAEVLCAQVTSYVVGTARLTNPDRIPDLLRTAREQVDAARGLDGRVSLPAVNDAECAELL